MFARVCVCRSVRHSLSRYTQSLKRVNAFPRVSLGTLAVVRSIFSRGTSCQPILAISTAATTLITLARETINYPRANKTLHSYFSSFRSYATNKWINIRGCVCKFTYCVEQRDQYYFNCRTCERMTLKILINDRLIEPRKSF